MFTHFLIKPGAPVWLWILGVIGDTVLFGVVFFGLLQFIPGRFRKTFIAIITFLAGLIYAIEYFVPARPGTEDNFMTAFTEQVDVVTTVIFSFALGLGVYNLVRFHSRNVIRKKSGWSNSLAFFIAFFGLMIAGFVKEYMPSDKTANLYDLLFQGTIVSLGATMFSVIGFYIISAAYRAFRIRSAEATLMLVAAFIVMLGQVPIGAAMTNWIPDHGFYSNFRFENVSYWILKQPNMAAWRGISFGVEIGALAMALRTWLSLERGSFFDQEL
ncbi:MAG: hypothetical protein ACYC27_13595 [Armatimonadota bacterium]